MRGSQIKVVHQIVKFIGGNVAIFADEFQMVKAN